METKHTKGEWNVNYNTTAHLPYSYVICDKQETDDEAEANAKLIAAAPDMLEALSILVDFDKDDVELYKERGVTLTLNKLQYTQIVNAITKATK